MSERKKVVIRFGVLENKLVTQLKKQGLTLDKDDALHFEKDIEAINRLRIRGIIKDSHIDYATKKVQKNILKSIKQLS